MTERLTEKLKRAAAAVPDLEKSIEARVDKLLARKAELEGKRDRTFEPHEQLLDDAEKGLDQLDNALRQLSNESPLSGGG